MTGETNTTIQTVDVEVDETKKTGSSFYKEKLSLMQKEIESRDSMLKDLQAKVEEAEHKKLQEANNFKQLYEMEIDKRKKAEDKSAKLAESFFNDKKMSAIKQKATQEGIDQSCLKWLDKADHTPVQIETTSTGSVNVLGVDEFIQSFKMDNPTFFPSKVAPNINNSAPSNTNTTYSSDDLLKLERSDPAAYRKEVEKMLLSRK
jgi:type I site-specific restriction-modification system R (restriction) subunit